MGDFFLYFIDIVILFHFTVLTIYHLNLPAVVNTFVARVPIQPYEHIRHPLISLTDKPDSALLYSRGITFWFIFILSALGFINFALPRVQS